MRESGSQSDTAFADESPCQTIAREKTRGKARQRAMNMKPIGNRRMKAVLFIGLLALLLGAIMAFRGTGKNDAAEFYHRAEARYNQGDLKGALADINRAIELDPKYA